MTKFKAVCKNKLVVAWNGVLGEQLHCKNYEKKLKPKTYTVVEQLLVRVKAKIKFANNRVSMQHYTCLPGGSIPTAGAPQLPCNVS